MRVRFGAAWQQRKPRDGWGRLLGAQLLLALAFIFVATLDPRRLDGAKSAFALLPGGILAASCCLRTARHDGIDSRSRRAWTLLAGSALLWTLNDGLWYLAALLDLAPDSAWRSVYYHGYLLDYVMLAAGLFAFPRVPGAGLELALDVSVVVLSAGLAGGRLLASALAGSEDPTVSGLSTLQILVDLILVTAGATLALQRQTARLRPAFALLTGALSFNLAMDLEYSALNLLGYRGESGFGNALQAASQFLTCAAAYVYRHARPEEPGEAALARGSVLLLPYAATASALVALLWTQWRESSPAGLAEAGLAAALTAAVLARQFLAVRDTERLRFEREVQAQAGRLRAEALRTWQDTFAAIEWPLVILDASLRIRHINPAAQGLAGVWSAQGRHLPELGAHEPWATLGLLARGALARASDTRTARVSQAGRTWDVSVQRVSPGDPAGLLAIARDVTSAVEHERLLRRSETLAAMGALLEGVAHHVRNPLFALTANVDAFQAGLGREHGHEVFLKTSRAELQRLVDLMEDLLEYSGTTAERQPASILAPMCAAVSSCRGLAEQAGVHVEVISRDRPMVLMDERRMRLVFVNLVKNALQHTPRGGRVELLVRQVEAGGAVECMVRDTGSGFSGDDAERAFEPFFSTRKGGAGLGLALASRVVLEHDGTIVASNGPFGGALVTVRLQGLEMSTPPARTGNARAGGVRPERKARTPKGSVLVNGRWR